MWDVPQSFAVHNLYVDRDIPVQLQRLSKKKLTKLFLKHHPDKGGNSLRFMYLKCIRQHVFPEFVHMDMETDLIELARRKAEHAKMNADVAKLQADIERDHANEAKRVADRARDSAHAECTTYFTKESTKATKSVKRKATGRPRGRPPKNTIWDYTLCMYVPRE